MLKGTETIGEEKFFRRWRLICYVPNKKLLFLLQVFQAVSCTFLANQIASALFRLLAAVGRNLTVSSTMASFVFLMLFTNCGFVLSRGMGTWKIFEASFPEASPKNTSFLSLCHSTENMKKWFIWGYWISPMMYGEKAMAVNEFLGKSWSRVISFISHVGIFVFLVWWT